MTLGELYRVISNSTVVELVQSNTIYYHGRADQIPLTYMDAAVNYFNADYRHPTCDLREVSVYIKIVLCE